MINYLSRNTLMKRSFSQRHQKASLRRRKYRDFPSTWREIRRRDFSMILERHSFDKPISSRSQLSLYSRALLNFRRLVAIIKPVA